MLGCLKYLCIIMLMILLIHIIVALASLVVSLLAFFIPSQTKLKTSYILIASTVVSGSLLLILSPGHILEGCIAGLVYSVFTVAITISTNRKLATAKFNRRYLHNDGL